MKTLIEAINEYVSMRQGLGFKLVQVEGLLKSFATFMDTQGRSWVTTELALQWAIQPAGAQPASWAKRLNAVRQDLKSSEPDDATVAEIAGRWGFWHTGNFAADYSRQFGELPSQTRQGAPR